MTDRLLFGFYFCEGSGGLMVSVLEDLWIGQPGFEPWPGTLACVIGQDKMGTDEFNAGGNPAMD